MLQLYHVNIEYIFTQLYVRIYTAAVTFITYVQDSPNGVEVEA